MLQNVSSREIVLAGVLGFLTLSGLAQGEPAIILLMVMLGVLFFYNRQQRMDEADERDSAADRSSGARRRSVRPRQAPPPPPTREQQANQIYNHALEAVRRAGLDPDTMPVLPVDLGVFAYFDGEAPVIHRLQPIEDDVDYLQPFIQLRVPVAAQGKIRFELLDELGVRRYIHEDQQTLQRGRNLIVPSTRMPIHDEHDTMGKWRLRVIVDNMTIAEHTLTWIETDSHDIRQHVQEDGEISSEMRAMLAENRLQTLSLDELLADQADPNEADAGRRRSR